MSERTGGVLAYNFLATKLAGVNSFFFISSNKKEVRKKKKRKKRCMQKQHVMRENN